MITGKFQEEINVKNSFRATINQHDIGRFTVVVHGKKKIMQLIKILNSLDLEDCTFQKAQPAWYTEATDETT